MKVTPISHSNIASLEFNNIEFGKVFTDYMLVSDFDGEKWSEVSITSLQNMEMHPATSVLHYGQAIFEGLKAYKNEEGEVNIFRLKDNLNRMNASASRMKMPELNVDAVYDGILEFVRLQKDWIPTQEYGSLYIRPFMIATDHTLRALSSQTYRFMVIACPVGFYYSTPLSIYLEKSYRRAAKGGVGYAKAAGNYAASFYPTDLAKQDGFDQILWTDITNDYSLEELGSANFFFVKNGIVYTPEIHDSILKGITRDTLINLAQDAGMEVRQEKITADEFKNALKHGEVDCMFATGTAAAITFINEVSIDGEKFQVNSNSFSPVMKLEENLIAIKYLKNQEHPEWNVVV
jgi:branched-chain amino acid aminotransferase